MRKTDCCRRLYGVSCLKLKMSEKILGAKVLDTLKISIASVCKFRVCTETDLSSSSKSSQLETVFINYTETPFMKFIYSIIKSSTMKHPY